MCGFVDAWLDSLKIPVFVWNRKNGDSLDSSEMKRERTCQHEQREQGICPLHVSLDGWVSQVPVVLLSAVVFIDAINIAR